jgi:hypothetical protein
MATRAYREGKKLYWDRKADEIVDQPPASRERVARSAETALQPTVADTTPARER